MSESRSDRKYYICRIDVRSLSCILENVLFCNHVMHSFIKWRSCASSTESPVIWQCLHLLKLFFFWKWSITILRFSLSSANLLPLEKTKYTLSMTIFSRSWFWSVPVRFVCLKRNNFGCWIIENYLDQRTGREITTLSDDLPTHVVTISKYLRQWDVYRSRSLQKAKRYKRR